MLPRNQRHTVKRQPSRAVIDNITKLYKRVAPVRRIEDIPHQKLEPLLIQIRHSIVILCPVSGLQAE